MIYVEPGLYNEMSFADYSAQDAITRRHLVVDRNWQRTRYNLDNDKEDTEARIFGRAVHAVVLDAASADKEFYFTEEYSRATKEGKARWEEDTEKANGRTIIRNSQEIYDMAASVCRHPGAASLLTGGNAEVSIFWKEGIDLCKARLDYLRDGLVVELKTTTSAAERDFSREIAKFGYHYQLAWYRRAIGKYMPVRGAAIIAVEKTPPYCVATYYLANEDLDRAESVLMKRLDEFRKCRDEANWSGYSGSPQLLSLPAWAFSDTNDDLDY